MSSFLQDKIVELERYLPPLTRREDFDDFWVRTRAQAEAALGPRLQILGPVPPARAAALEAQAGGLVSIGNAAANQLPTKLFE